MGALLDGRKITPQGNNNYGDYNSEKTNQLIDQALAAADKNAAGGLGGGRQAGDDRRRLGAAHL